MLTSMDRNGHTTEFTYGGSPKNLTSVKTPKEGGGFRTVSFQYDGFDNVTKAVDDLGQEVNVTFDKLDRAVTIEDAVRKKHSNASKAYEFTYDVLGRAKTAKDTENKTTSVHYAPFCSRQATDSARGIRTVQHFDSLCRLVQVEVGTPHSTEALELDTVTETRDFVYDDLNRLVSSTQKPVSFSGSAAKYGVAKFGVDPYSASDEDGLIRTYHYDVLDRLTSVVFEDGKTASFEYWPEGQLKKMTDPDGKVTLYEYHPNGSLAKVKLERGGSVVGEFVYAYDAVGLPESITYPTETGIVAWFKSAANARGWNENGQLLHLRYLKGGVPLREFEFDYDAAGNRIKQVDISSAGTFEWKYSYDYLDRLTKVEKKTGAGPLLEMSIYAYDESDNRTVLELPQDVVKFVYGYDDADQIATMEKRNRSTNALILTETFGSDDDGNVISRFNDDTGVTISYSWDSFNKLVAVSSADSGGPTNDAKQENSYLANGFRRKKKAKSGAVTTEYSAGLSTAMAKVGSDPISYIQGHHILGFERGGSFYWFLTDALGSVRDIVSGTDGAVLQSYDYRENGEKTASTSFQSDKTWVGGLSVNDDTADSGLYMMGHRHFDSSTGRFLSRDPIGFAGGMNLYSYGNSPVQMVDPEGLQEGFPFSQPSELFSKIVKEAKVQLRAFGNWILDTAGWAPGPVGTAATVASSINAAAGEDCNDPLKLVMAVSLSKGALNKLKKKKWPGRVPEARYLGTGKHGVNWEEGAHMAKNGPTDQGRWTEASLWHASLNAAGLEKGQSAYFDLPLGTGATVYRAGSGEAVPATRMWIWVRDSGKFHGYPSL